MPHKANDTGTPKAMVAQLMRIVEAQEQTIADVKAQLKEIDKAL